jgi:hypothetical protein
MVVGSSSEASPRHLGRIEDENVPGHYRPGSHAAKMIERWHCEGPFGETKGVQTPHSDVMKTVDVHQGGEGSERSGKAHHVEKLVPRPCSCSAPSRGRNLNASHCPCPQRSSTRPLWAIHDVDSSITRSATDLPLGALLRSRRRSTAARH